MIRKIFTYAIGILLVTCLVLFIISKQKNTNPFLNKQDVTAEYAEVYNDKLFPVRVLFKSTSCSGKYKSISNVCEAKVLWPYITTGLSLDNKGDRSIEIIGGKKSCNVPLKRKEANQIRVSEACPSLTFWGLIF